ncbi:tripartite tricarboxylate transporter TctB family protein [Ectothiorhodospiraceae bacterium WFHF3C12]|nr:tripartite tricarboxylate transporter TctB family protein [Ectothiorhodospiraceae bacterium WFHF3C12]
MNSRVLNILYGVVFLGSSIYLYWVSVETGVDARRVSSDPMWYPQLLLILLGLCAGYLVLRSVLTREASPVQSVVWKPLAATLAAAGTYLAVFEKLGFVPSTVVLIPLLSWLLGFRRVAVLVVLTVSFTAAVWYGFHLLLNETPPGIGLPTFTG